MKFQYLLPAAAAALVSAQDPSLVEALSSKNDTLSTLIGLVQSQDGLLDTLAGLEDITILAPSNDALEKFLAMDGVSDLVAADPGIVSAILTYHVINGTYNAKDITETPAFVPSLLNNATYANVTGGQVVEAVAMGDTVSFYSGLKMQSNVTEADIKFSGGVIHIINEVLTLPAMTSTTAVTLGLRSLAGALTTAKLISPGVDTLNDLTIFAPNDDAFAAIASATGDLDENALSGILSYHVIRGTVAYSSSLSSMSVETLTGTNVTITVNNDGVFVNGAKVIIPDVLVANGVVHVIDSVLNPEDADSKPNLSATTPAFPGASSVSDGAVPFTSGIPEASAMPTPAATPSESGAGEEKPTPTEMSTGAGARATAVVAMGALFGGAAVVMNGL